MSERLVLYYSRFCIHSLKSAALLDFCRAAHEKREVAYGAAGRLPFSAYGETPVLIHGPRVIEDPREVLRYIDEQFAPDPLAALAAEQQAAVFDALEHLDACILPALGAVLLLGGGGEQRYMRSLEQLGCPLPLRLWKRIRFRRLLARSSDIAAAHYRSDLDRALAAARELIGRIGPFDGPYRVCHICLWSVLDAVRSCQDWRAAGQDQAELEKWCEAAAARIRAGAGNRR